MVGQFEAEQREKLNALMNGKGNTMPFYTYTEYTVPKAKNNDNIELLKKNGDLIGKYYQKLGNLIVKAKSEDLDVSNDILDLLNNFAYDRDKLWADTPLVSIPSVWSTDADNENVKATVTTNAEDFKAYEKVKKFDEDLKKVSDKENDDDFYRLLSLTNAEVKKGDKWFSEHQKKYHKDFLKKIKKNPFYGGASPVASCYWKWMACSLGTSCDIICEDCEKKYKEAEAKAYELHDELTKYTEDHKSEHDAKNPFSKDPEYRRLKSKMDKAYKEKDKLYEQSRLELRGIDE